MIKQSLENATNVSFKTTFKHKKPMRSAVFKCISIQLFGFGFIKLLLFCHAKISHTVSHEK